MEDIADLKKSIRFYLIKLSGMSWKSKVAENRVKVWS